MPYRNVDVHFLVRALAEALAEYGVASEQRLSSCLMLRGAGTEDIADAIALLLVMRLAVRMPGNLLKATPRLHAFLEPTDLDKALHDLWP